MSQVNPKHGENKGTLAVKKLRKREEAEERNAKTKPENTRAHRRRLEGGK